MGCSSSGPGNPVRVRSAARPVFSSDDSEEDEKVRRMGVELSQDEQNEKDVNTILDSISSLPIPGNISPVVSVSDSSFPILIVDFSFDDVQQINLRLPILVVSNTRKGKYLVFGSVEFLYHKNIHKTEMSALIENIGMWGTNFKLKSVKILLYGFASHLASSILTDLTSFGFIVEQSNEILPDHLAYDFVFLPSYIDDPTIHNRLEEFASNGGSLVIFSAIQTNKPETKFCMNKLLTKVGISIPRSNLTPVYNNIKSQPYEILTTKSMKYLCSSLFELLKEEEKNINLIDELVATLRYYLSSVGEEQGEFSSKFVSRIWEYLEEEEYERDGIYCPEILHSLLAILLSDIMAHIPAKYVQIAPPSHFFPGDCGSVEMESVKLRIKISHRHLTSTGLYLPAGQIGFIKCDSPIFIQVGLHDEYLLVKTGQWKRWPSISYTFQIGRKVESIATSFGGIVYVGSEENKSIVISFQNFCRYPRYSVQEDSWFGTENQLVPWTELEMKSITITLPTKIVQNIPNLHSNLTQLERIINEAHLFLGIQICVNRRIVFDVDLVNDSPEIGDIIIVDINLLPKSLIGSELSEELIRLVSIIVSSSIPEDLLDDDAIISLAAVSTCYCLSQIFIDDNPSHYLDSNISPLFSQLWELLSQNPKNFSNSVSSFMTLHFAENTAMGEKWESFISFLSNGTNLGPSSPNSNIYHINGNSNYNSYVNSSPNLNITMSDNYLGDFCYSSNSQSQLPRNSSLLKLGERFKMTNLLSSSSSDFLQQYQLSEISSNSSRK